jgi:hypothetical protein
MNTRLGIRDLFLLMSILFAFSPVCAQSGLDLLASYLTGSFSSQEQAAADTNYFDIRLEMKRIWSERGDGYWFYVEQAAASKLERPYRQRVYHVTAQDDGSIRSDIYTLPNPLRFAGAWKLENPLADLTPDSLEIREGCAVILRKTADESFEGSTVGTGCASELRGASYATSEVRISPEQLLSWDRGFDVEGKQAWGATKGGYVFRKLK